MATKTAKIVYRPVGLASSILGGVVAGMVFKQVWKRIEDEEDAPGRPRVGVPVGQDPARCRHPGRDLLGRQGIVERGGAIAFERWFGEWPGD